MAAAGYTYDRLESADNDLRFFVSGGSTVHYGSLTEAEEWLNGVIFDDPEVSAQIEKIMHPYGKDGESEQKKDMADLMTDSFTHVFQVYKSAIPKINYYLSKAVPDILPEKAPIEVPAIEKESEKAPSIQAEEKEKGKAIADQNPTHTITTKNIRETRMYDREISELLKLKKSVETGTTAPMSTESMPVLHNQYELISALQQLPEGGSLILYPQDAQI